MRRTDVIVIGGGQAGLAASYCLTARGIDHVVLERGRIAERWRSTTWDSLRLQTPRWQSRLPGWTYRGPDQLGFMTVAELVAYLVRSVRPHPIGYLVDTDGGGWLARAVVIATGHCDVPAVPAFATALSRRVVQLTPSTYKHPGALPPGGVLVVGASASGVVIAEELGRAGREVTLAVGRHTRVPRQHCGHDIYAWLDAIGTLDDPRSKLHDLDLPSLQLIGDARTIDLSTLAADGIRLAGRLLATEGEAVTFADDLAESTSVADRRASRLIDRLDAFAIAYGLRETGPRAVLTPAPLVAPPRALDLERSRIGTVIWCTGFRRDYPWLNVPGVVERGEIKQLGGITPAHGLYALGLRFMRKRNSNFLDGVGADAHAIVEHLAHRFHDRAAA